MRPALAAISLVLIALPAAGQTPSSITSLNGGRRDRCPSDGTTVCRSTQGLVAGNNPWLLAAETSIKPLAGSGFSEQWLLMSGKLVHEVDLGPEGILGGMRLPVMANLADVVSNLGDGTKKDSLDAAIQSLTTSADGLNIGVFPYWPLARETSPVRATLFGGVAAKLNQFPDSATNTKQTLLSGRFSTGIEFAIGLPRDDDKPLTVSFAATYARFGAETYEKVFGERRSSLLTGEVTAILPLKTGLGALFEGVAVQQKKPAFRLGLLFSAASKSTPAGSTPPDRSGPTPGACSGTLCQVTVKLDAGATDVTVSATADAAAELDPASCALNVGKTCLFRGKKDATVTLTVPATHAFSGGGCNGQSCAVKLGGAGTITVTKAPQ